MTKPRALPTWQTNQIRTLWRCASAERGRRDRRREPKRYFVVMDCDTCTIRATGWWCARALAFLGAHAQHRTNIRFHPTTDVPDEAYDAHELRSEWIRIAWFSLLEEGDQGIDDLASAVGVSIPTARRRMREFVASGEIERTDGARSGQKAVYALPKA